MMKSFFTGITGLSTNAEAMGVIGDNIANVKTVGFKSNMVTFANVLGQVIEGNTVGNGTKIWEVATTWAQGAPETTGNATDLAINGRGFFIVEDADGTPFYTRAGQFHFDKDRFLVNPDGLRVQGNQIDAETGAIGTTISDIQYSTSDALATSEVRTTLNLDAGAADGDTFMTTMTAYDSLGAPVDLTITFTKTGANTWGWEATVDPSVGTVASTGTLEFDSTGVLQPPAADPTIDITGLSNGANDLSISWLFTNEAGESDGTITGYAMDSAVTYLVQDGYPPGTVQSISVDEEGYVFGLYSNGVQRAIYRIALADFPNYQGLNTRGDNLFSESLASGEVVTGYPADGRRGTLSPGALEMSNVDLSREFVNLITTQRAYQANSKVIITSDEMLAELMNIKR